MKKIMMLSLLICLLCSCSNSKPTYQASNPKIESKNLSTQSINGVETKTFELVLTSEIDGKSVTYSPTTIITEDGAISIGTGNTPKSIQSSLDDTCHFLEDSEANDKQNEMMIQCYAKEYTEDESDAYIIAYQLTFDESDNFEIHVLESK